MSGIERVEAYAVQVALGHPVRSAVRRADHLIAVIVRVHADSGEGAGFVSAFTPGGAVAIRALIEELGSTILGSDATDPTRVHARMREHLRLIGTSGPSASAIAAVDIALWDLFGQIRQSPVHRLIGTHHRTDLAVYSSDGCWLVSPEQVVEEAQAATERGFDMIKVRVGRRDLDVDLHVLDCVRETLGRDVGLIVDANQAWNREVVEKATPELARIGIEWLEEPLPARDFEGYDNLNAVGLKIAAGESLFDIGRIERLVAGGRIAVLTPDLQRVGGVTGWLRAAERTQQHVALMSSHLYPEFSAQLLATQPTPGPVESVSWALPFAVPSTHPRRGRLVLPEEPGFGVNYDWDAVCRLDLKVGNCQA